MGSQFQTTTCQVPVVDFTDEKLKQPGTEEWNSACKLIRGALEDHGFFYALCDKVPMELHNSVFTLMGELFDLPLETKMQKSNSDKPYHGYYGQYAQIPLYESLGISDPLTVEEVQKFTKIMWPSGYDHFWYSTAQNYLAI